jgi:hypothetical protein
MGFLANFLVRRMKDPVEGTATVVRMDPEALGVDEDGNAFSSGGYVMDCQVSAPGLEPTAVRHRGDAFASNWPAAGDTLPITVDRAKPKRFVIHWDRVG